MYINDHQSYIPKDILSDEFLKIGYSQGWEDDVIRSFFWEDIMNKRTCKYLDIGCFREDLYSNTKNLSLVGWNGIAVDANPDFLIPWLEKRPRDIFLNKCIRSSDQEDYHIDFYIFDIRAMSTSNRNRAKQLVSRGYKLEEIRKINSISLPDLGRLALDQIGPNIDFISIDVECLDYLDDLQIFLDLLKPRLFCMEAIDEDINLLTIEQRRDVSVLRLLGYEVHSVVGENLFFSPPIVNLGS